MLNNFLEIIIPLFLSLIFLLLYFRLRLKRLKTYRSPILGKIEVYQKYNKEKVLVIENYAQGVSIEDKSIDRSYWFFIAQKVIEHCKGKKTSKTLMLGLGANTISSLISKLNPRTQQTVIEIDDQIIQACKDFFNLDQIKNLHIINADAYKIINQRKDFNSKFDCIIVDIFTGKAPFVSKESNTPTFIQNLTKWLNKDGLIIFNRPGTNKQTIKECLQLEEALKILFKKTKIEKVSDPRGYKNNLIWAKTKIRN